MEEIKVGYVAGHGLHTPGKETPNGEKEWSFNDKVARAFHKELSQYEGIVLKRFDDPTGQRDVPLQERTDGANAWGADYYFSFHHNALRGVWGTHSGVESYIYDYAQAGSIALAEAIHPALVKAYGLPDRGIKRENLHDVRETTMPAILTEGGFMDSTIDIHKLRDDKVLENAGILIAQAFAKFVGRSKVATTPTPSEPTPNPTPAPPKLTVDGSWGPATTKALQRHYGTTVDGVISGQPKNQSTLNIPSVQFGTSGSQLIRAMQKDLGTTVDGIISAPSQMVKALQKRFGTIQDGVISNPSLMVKAMQKALNEGKF